ncbi:hypothetical protein MTR_5g012750 [Medicago truncatula]|uniref:Uncharacterized protein n=1 Tax=Medicago truncatula TaxID=3880 RepID=G7JW45_MEDTR|nr:hypothetical protein MTR_5g012750 [Medicago truncatula]
MRAGSGPAPGMLLGKTESHRNESDPEAVQSKPLPVRCGSRTNQAEAGGHVTPPLGGHVTPEADEGGEWSGS